MTSPSTSSASLADAVVSTHQAAMAHVGHGKAAAFAARRAAIDALAAQLVANGLHEGASDPDVLDIALGRQTVDSVNARLSALDDEAEAETEEPTALQIAEDAYEAQVAEVVRLRAEGAPAVDQAAARYRGQSLAHELDAAREAAADDAAFAEAIQARLAAPAAPVDELETLGTLTSDPGGFGAALASLSFLEATPGVEPQSWVFDHEAWAITVTCYADDDSVTLSGGTWEATFTGTTPQAVVLAAIAASVGRLPITR